MYHLDGMKRQRIGIITVERGHIRFDSVCHGIHTGKRGQLGRHRLSQIRINNRYVRSDVEISQRIFDTLVVIRNYTECRYLGSSTGG